MDFQNQLMRVNQLCVQQEHYIKMMNMQYLYHYNSYIYSPPYPPVMDYSGTQSQPLNLSRSSPFYKLNL